MEKVQVDLGKDSYPIYIGKGLLDNISGYLGKRDKLLILTDKNVDALYGDRLEKNLGDEAFCKYVIEPGESSKNMDTVIEILSYMLKEHLTRESKVIAFGGGVVGDIAGFCASVYMRGIPFVQVPTTLLAQVDSSVGGKTGVNLSQWKNMIGTFYQPKAVIIDTDVLYSLPQREFMSGIGEVVKYGIIQDSTFFNYLKENIHKIKNMDEVVMQHVIQRCCQIKGQIVALDEKERGMRKILNFGHTIGHALEGMTQYQKYTHGEAVLIGMYVETFIARRLGVIPEDYFYEIRDFIQNLGVDVDISMYDVQKLIEIMMGDKKNAQGKISFLLPVERGKMKEYLLDIHEIQW